MTAGGQDIESLFRLFNEIGIIAQLSGNAFEKVMPAGMTLPQFVVLNHLTRLGGNKTPLDLARAMQVTKGTMTNTLGHLERAGHISIVPDQQDRRSKRVDITEAGRAAREQAIWALAPELKQIGDRFSPQIVRELLPHLATLRAILDSRRAG
jgi:DNA-binding MarR family transcriptional regulator